MKLTDYEILAIEDFLTRRETGVPTCDLIPGLKGSKTYRRQLAYSVISALKAIGVKLDNGRVRNGFGGVTAQELAEFRAWKQFRDQALNHGASQ